MRWLMCVAALVACSPGPDSPADACAGSDDELLGYVYRQTNVDGTDKPEMGEVFDLCGDRVVAAVNELLDR